MPPEPPGEIPPSVYLPLVACGPGVSDTSQCTPITLLTIAAAVSSICSIVGVVAYLVLCAVQMFREMSERMLAMITGFAFFLTLSTLQAGIAMTAIAYFCDVFLGLGREYYSAQTGATEEEANIAVALVSDHSLVKWAGIMGLITACFTLFDAVARLLTSGGREDAGPVRSYTSKRAKTADPGAISSTSYPPAAGIDLPQPTPAPTAGGGNENPFFGGGAGGRL
jgi:hypothetical protein